MNDNIKYEENILFLGDCREYLDIVEENSIDLVITDPPYFLDGLDDKWNTQCVENKKQKAHRIGGLPVGMRFHVNQGRRFQEFYYEIAKKIWRVMKPGAFFLSFSQPRLYHRMAIAIEDAGFELRDQYAWHYKKGQMKAFSMEHFVNKMSINDREKKAIKQKLEGRKTPQLRPQFESIALAQKPKEGTFIENWCKWGVGLIDVQPSLDGNTPATLMYVEKPNKEEYNTHLTVKPVQLLEHIISIFSKQGQRILDPFLGSGTTAVAAHNTQRKYIGIEQQSEYMCIIQRRLDAIGSCYTRYDTIDDK